MPKVFQNADEIIEVGSAWITRLKAAASASPLRRARLCLHHGAKDNIQEMILVLCSDVLFRQHRHLNKTESFHIIEGELDLIIFSESGKALQMLPMGPVGSGKTFCYRLNAPLYHALLPRSEFVVFHETTEGPFCKDSAQYAPWAPQDLTALRAFLEDSIKSNADGATFETTLTRFPDARARDGFDSDLETINVQETFINQHCDLVRPKRVVVLGASGFLGRDLLQEMDRRQVEAIPVSSSELDLTSERGQQTLTALLRPADSVVMLAIRKPGRHLDEQAFVANIEMAGNVCCAVRKVKCAHLLYISTEAVYPFVRSSIREGLRVSPVSLYGSMHLAREAMFRGVDGIPLAILRLAQVYGPEDPHGAYGPKRMVTSALTEGRIVLY